CKTQQAIVHNSPGSPESGSTRDFKLASLFNISQDRCNTLWQRLCIVCVPGCGACQPWTPFKATAYRCNRCRTVHTGTGVFISYIHWVADWRSLRSCSGNGGNISAIIHL